MHDLELEAIQSTDNTVAVSAEVLKIMREHNGRFWRFGKTNTQKKFEDKFKPTEPEPQSNDDCKIYKYNGKFY